jgi:hypothetical protein
MFFLVRFFFLDLVREKDSINSSWVGSCFYFVIDYGHRGHGTAADTSHRIEIEFSIGSRLPWPDVESPLPRSESDVAPFDVTGCSHADLDRMLAGRGETELVVERGHTVNVDLWNVQKPSDFQHRFEREVAQLRLDLLQDRNQVALRALQACYYFSRPFSDFQYVIHENPTP